MKKTTIVLVTWIVIMFLVTFTSTLVYLVAQQSLRLGANEEPMRLAVETSIKMQNGQPASKAVPTAKSDISRSIAPFVFVFDKNKSLIATSATMGSTEPRYPSGVLDYVAQHGEDRVTWQPRSGLRYATVAIKSNNGYIVAGRSLRETEKLSNTIGSLVAMAWLACAGFSSLALGIIYLFLKRVDPLTGQ